MPPSEPDGWDVNRKLILAELDRLARDLQAIREAFDEFRYEDISGLRTDIALLKFKCSLWGIAGGSVGTLLIGAAAILLKLIK